ncbi:unnamed protein product [Sphagnum tenellum]
MSVDQSMKLKKEAAVAHENMIGLPLFTDHKERLQLLNRKLKQLSPIPLASSSIDNDDGYGRQYRPMSAVSCENYEDENEETMAEDDDVVLGLHDDSSSEETEYREFINHRQSENDLEEEHCCNVSLMVMAESEGDKQNEDGGGLSSVVQASCEDDKEETRLGLFPSSREKFMCSDVEQSQMVLQKLQNAIHNDGVSRRNAAAATVTRFSSMDHTSTGTMSMSNPEGELVMETSTEILRDEKLLMRSPSTNHARMKSSEIDVWIKKQFGLDDDMGTLTSLSHDCEVKEDDGEAQRQEKIESQVDVELHLDHHKQSPSNSVSVACELGCIPATAELQTTIFQQQLFEADDEDEDVVCGDYHDLSEYSDEEEEELSLQELRAVNRNQELIDSRTMLPQSELGQILEHKSMMWSAPTVELDNKILDHDENTYCQHFQSTKPLVMGSELMDLPTLEPSEEMKYFLDKMKREHYEMDAPLLGLPEETQAFLDELKRKSLARIMHAQQVTTLACREDGKLIISNHFAFGYAGSLDLVLTKLVLATVEKLDKELQEKERHAASVMFSTPATDHSHSIQSSSQGDCKENSHAEELIREEERQQQPESAARMTLENLDQNQATKQTDHVQRNIRLGPDARFFSLKPEEEALVEQILSQPDPIEFDTTTDGCSTSSYVSTGFDLVGENAKRMAEIDAQLEQFQRQRSPSSQSDKENSEDASDYVSSGLISQVTTPQDGGARPQGILKCHPIKESILPSRISNKSSSKGSNKGSSNKDTCKHHHDQASIATNNMNNYLEEQRDRRAHHQEAMASSLPYKKHSNFCKILVWPTSKR